MLYESGGAFSEKNSAKRWARKRSGISVEELYGETIIDRGVSWERTYQRLNCHRNSNSKTTRLQKISGTKRWNALKRPRNAIQTKVELLQNIIEPLLDFLREKTAADREIKQQKSKLSAKQQEQESQQQMMKAMLIQQQQLNNAFLNVVKSYLQCILSDQLSKCLYSIKTGCCCCIRFA